MSYINKYRLEAYQKAYWYFANQDSLDSESEFYAKEFEKYALENMGEDLEDLFAAFLADIKFSEEAEKDKERTRYA